MYVCAENQSILESTYAFSERLDNQPKKLFETTAEFKVLEDSVFGGFLI